MAWWYRKPTNSVVISVLGNANSSGNSLEIIIPQIRENESTDQELIGEGNNTFVRPTNADSALLQSSVSHAKFYWGDLENEDPLFQESSYIH